VQKARVNIGKKRGYKMSDSLSELVNKTLDRIQLANQMREQLFPGDPFYVAYSGGKDSDVIRILFALADVPHDLWHNHTTVDAPETVYYIRSIPDINISKPEMTMWQ
jgi:phosphoadenosine phosphosulfate reductase